MGIYQDIDTYGRVADRAAAVLRTVGRGTVVPVDVVGDRDYLSVMVVAGVSDGDTGIDISAVGYSSFMGCQVEATVTVTRQQWEDAL